MKKVLISKLLLATLISSSVTGIVATNAQASPVLTESMIQESLYEEVEERAAYDWWVYNLGVSGYSSSQIMGPVSGGYFNTEGMLGANRTFKISWSGAPSNASFYIRVTGMESSNSGHILNSGTATGSSGSVNFTIPYADRGTIKLEVVNQRGDTINIGSIHVDSR